MKTKRADDREHCRYEGSVTFEAVVLDRKKAYVGHSQAKKDESIQNVRPLFIMLKKAR